MFGKFFDWLSNLRPRQLFLLAAAAAVIIFCIMYIGLKKFSSSNMPLPVNVGQEVPAQIPEIKMKSVVVARRNIEAKSMIVGSMLETKEFPENALPPDAVTDVAEIANKPAKIRIMMGEVITHAKVYRNIEQSGFVGSIPPDCRAVSINLNDVTGVAGFAKPGDYVDVLLIETTDDVVTSRLILQNVLLLSINKSMNADQAQSQPPPQQQKQQQQGQQQQPQESTVNPATQAIAKPALATLALRPDEVLQLVSASKIGEIYLMLRPLVPQGDYYNGAEYTIESIKAQRERIEAEQARRERVEAEQEAKNLVEAMIKAQNPNQNRIPKEQRIEIMYGDREELEDTNQTVPASQTAAAQNAANAPNAPTNN